MNYLLSIIIAMVTSIFSSQQTPNYKSLGVTDFETIVQKEGTQLLDVRTPDEYAEGHLPNSINLNVMNGSFESAVDEKLSKDKPVAVYCRSGQRSKKAAAILSKKGYTVYDLDKGIISWQQADKDIVK